MTNITFEMESIPRDEFNLEEWKAHWRWMILHKIHSLAYADIAKARGYNDVFEYYRSTEKSALFHPEDQDAPKISVLTPYYDKV